MLGIVQLSGGYDHVGNYCRWDGCRTQHQAWIMFEAKRAGPATFTSAFLPQFVRLHVAAVPRKDLCFDPPISAKSVDARADEYISSVGIIESHTVKA